MLNYSPAFGFVLSKGGVNLRFKWPTVEKPLKSSLSYALTAFRAESNLNVIGLKVMNM